MLPSLSFFFRLADTAKAETLPRFRKKNAVINKQQSGFDPVTECDRTAEWAIRKIILQEFPDHGILSEEYDSIRLDSENIWVIDPIDGTKAFISGLPLWGTMIGFQYRKKSILGLIDHPFTGERYFADGKSSYYWGQEGNRIIKVRTCSSLSNAIIFTTSPSLFSPNELEYYRLVENCCILSRYGADCYAYTLLASGYIDLVIEADLKPYDIGAVIPLIEQAGGIITNWKGERAEQGGRILASGSKEVYHEALSILSQCPTS
ncbi:putative monophosphatase protein [Liberibacter crescens BT-1]|uniref:Histidinol-phosphatase n=1 Tax=Liberibacter crescens (strain BT-1) TaxID=1215343 RepID=L0EXK9_LIBCB|nr:histidinol-phosphatase [Liberibacter crescens]AGA65106.1 putative monophosphatase protein [Liberibacter crescens BT-1]AMC13083.1 inositol monophosphatase [Liberibacter crescens]